MEFVRLHAPGISCAGWVITIRTAVGRLEGVATVGCDEKMGTVSVEYDPAVVTVDAIQEAMRRVGYEAAVLGWDALPVPPGGYRTTGVACPEAGLGRQT